MCWSENAMPTLTASVTSRPASAIGAFTAPITRLATSIECSSLSVSRSRIANSSPPSRAAVSTGRMQSDSRPATS